MKHVAGLKAITPFERIYLSGKGLDEPEIAELATAALCPFGRMARVPMLPGTWVKHAAQGSAVLADALAGGRFAPLASSLQLASAAGSVWHVLERSYR